MQLHKLQVYNVMIWFMYILQNDYNNRLASTSILINNYISFCGDKISDLLP